MEVRVCKAIDCVNQDSCVCVCISGSEVQKIKVMSLGGNNFISTLSLPVLEGSQRKWHLRGEGQGKNVPRGRNGQGSRAGSRVGVRGGLCVTRANGVCWRDERRSRSEGGHLRGAFSDSRAPSPVLSTTARRFTGLTLATSKCEPREGRAASDSSSPHPCGIRPGTGHMVGTR